LSLTHPAAITTNRCRHLSTPPKPLHTPLADLSQRQDTASPRSTQKSPKVSPRSGTGVMEEFFEKNRQGDEIGRAATWLGIAGLRKVIISGLKVCPFCYLALDISYKLFLPNTLPCSCPARTAGLVQRVSHVCNAVYLILEPEKNAIWWYLSHVNSKSLPLEMSPERLNQTNGNHPPKAEIYS
jgi:hypothetical protein